ncbi:Citrate synthase [Planctomycetes bacterium Pla163]|uniref:Citrate synthase n=1 Tax=Rohdeia mirabilis TaxID=2528008 RepID=A0A518D148_9BACT|nr:Citrate synthase [Planctomycetes bacterium Pla163]
MTAEAKQLVPGLAGVPAAESAISYIDGNAGVLEYRGYPIEQLAERSTFEETAWLLMHGQLPTKSQLDAFGRDLSAVRELPDGMLALLGAFPKTAHPMLVLQSAIAALGAFEREVRFGDEEDFRRAWLRILAATPTIVAAFERLRRGEQPVAPRVDLSHAANFLYMLNGEEPDEIAARVLDVALVLHADHTMNASTFAARVVYGTNAGPYDSVSAAVGALHGPLHGGANERVLRSLETIGSVENVRAWADQQFSSKGKIMGFGHRVYKVKDPRSFALQSLGDKMFAKLGHTPIYDVALELEKVVVERLGDKGIHPNVDFFSGIIYQKLGLPTDQFTPIFAIARAAGWLAHLHEQMQDNKLFRPGQIYVGEASRDYVPIDNRV